MVIAEALTKARTILDEVNNEAAVDARVLLQHTLKCDRTYLYTYPDKPLTTMQNEQFFSYVKQRKQGEPIAYITGYKEFWGLRLAVSPATLIPRPETELLVETALELVGLNDANVLDLGTGTGAIALAMASERAGWQITGVDRITEAIELANQNRLFLAVENCQFLVSDWFSSIKNEKFSMIVSNPPYVEEYSDYLHQGDLRYEPQSALTASDDGYSDIFQIIDKAPNYLANNGWLVVEHGYKQAERIRERMRAIGFQLVETRQDLQQHPRITLGNWPS